MKLVVVVALAALCLELCQQWVAYEAQHTGEAQRS